MNKQPRRINFKEHAPTPKNTAPHLKSFKVAIICLILVVFASIVTATILVLQSQSQQQAAQQKKEQPYAAGINALPTMIGAIGDSLTQGANTEQNNVATVSNNWATGSNLEVDSIARRFAKAQGVDSVKTANVARSGNGTKDLASQVRRLNEHQPDFATFFIGVNDICGSNIRFRSMTPTEVFQSRIREALRTINPETKILAVSIVNLENLVKIGKEDNTILEAWSRTNVCTAMLMNAGSDGSEDVKRRAEVTIRVNEYNGVIKEECSKVANCTFDDYAINHLTFTKNDLSRFDYFHACINGQAKIADALWPVIQKMYPNSLLD
jgi:lysophospholipase L1-like esterase